MVVRLCKGTAAGKKVESGAVGTKAGCKGRGGGGTEEREA